MNSNLVGEYREGEIDGKPFLIYTLLSQTDCLINSSSSGEAAIDSGGDDPLFICPSIRVKKGGYGSFFPLVIPPQFPRIQSDDHDEQPPEYMLHSDSCKLPLLPLFWCNNKKPHIFDFICRACCSSAQRTSYYFCVTCGDQFHKECVESPLEIKHPSYPSLSLQLYSPPKHYSDDKFNCNCCDVRVYGMNYYCPTNNFHLDLFCAFKLIPIVIDHPKRHPHPLTFFPKQAFLPCNVCGLTLGSIPTYVCLRCVFVVHRECIYFPYVIRISRHHHRISFTYSFPSGKWSCGVCRQNVDTDFGAFTCNKCDNHYFVHSRCALRRDLWDGKELEGIPEEPEIVVEPFKTISDGVILHFSHGHNLKIEMSKDYDENKLCQACVLPVYEGSYYSCMDECDFILHEACANAPCKKYHALHPSPLTLVVVTDGYGDNKGRFNCVGCERESCGFVYENLGRGQRFKLCLRCASISEPFEYQGHEHPLFLALKPEEEDAVVCQICQEVGERYCCRKLNCIECDFVVCFKCATIPYKARYKHDNHFLTFYEVKKANDHSEWCDVCERSIGDPIDKGYYSRNKGFYSCDDCCTSLHIDCLLGQDIYMKPGQAIKYNMKFQILHNNTLSRPICNCGQRCPQKVLFRYKNYAFCSVSCLAGWFLME